MNRFNLKFLSFYMVTIALVVLLFNRVSTYGNTQLKAPPAIAGDYLIEPQKQRNCLTAAPLLLTIEQSGIYLTGLLKVGTSNAETKSDGEVAALNGKFQADQIQLSGVTSASVCSGNDKIEMVGSVTQDLLMGQLKILTYPGQTVNFIAQLQKSES